MGRLCTDPHLIQIERPVSFLTDIIFISVAFLMGRCRFLQLISGRLLGDAALERVLAERRQVKLLQLRQDEPLALVRPATVVQERVLEQMELVARSCLRGGTLTHCALIGLILLELTAFCRLIERLQRVH